MACSVVDTYVRPSNFELVQIADAIVVATPIRDVSERGKMMMGGTLRFRVDQVIKGEAPAEITVSRFVIGRTRSSDPDNIAYSHPEGHAGPCNRMTLTKDVAYMLFLGEENGEYATLSHPFSRVSEDYLGEDALWTRTVRTYVRLQAGETPMEQLASLEAMRAEIAGAPKATRAERALAADIGQHLGSVSPWKPTEYLLAAYADAKAGRPPRYKPRDEALEGEQSGIDAAVEALLGDLTGDRPAPEPRRSRQGARILNSLLQGEHRDAMPLFETFARPSASPDELAMAIRFMAANGRYRQAYDLIENRAAPLMSTASEDDFRTLGGAISEAQQDPIYGEGQPRWRSEPDIAARWPALALTLSTLSENRFRGSLQFTDTLKAMLGKDYRADPKLTLALSGDDNDIIAWAASELTRTENLTASQAQTGNAADDPLLLPLQIELRWHGLSDDLIDGLAKVFCLGPRQRHMVLEQWGQLGGESSALSFLRLAASPSVDAEDRRLLVEAIPAWERRYKAWWKESWLEKDPAMQKLAKGEPIVAADIAPLEPVRCPA